MRTLTRDEILAMTAGEEMNRLVALHVLGYCRAAFGRLSKRRAGTKLVPAECSYLIPPDSPALGTEQWAKPNSDLPLSDVPHVPSFSTDIAAAWEVVECLRLRGWRLFVGCDPAGSETHPYYCDTDHEVHVGCNVDGQSPAFAICRAALLSILQEGE